jgi:hypothetical protein
MKTRVKTTLKTSVLVLAAAAIAYVITDQYLVLDKRDQEYGTYDFFETPIDAVTEVTGTGKQHIDGTLVSTNIVIKNVLNKKDGLNLTQGEEITVYERYDILSNRHLNPIPLVPGRSVTGMGTGYQRLAKNERGTVQLHRDEQSGRIWIITVKR